MKKSLNDLCRITNSLKAIANFRKHQSLKAINDSLVNKSLPLFLPMRKRMLSMKSVCFIFIYFRNFSIAIQETDIPVKILKENEDF